MDCDLPGRVRIRIERAWLALRRADAVVAAAYFAVALVSSVLFALLTPPFQTPDEHQHFFRAYQIAAGARIEASGRAMGAVLPESLGALADKFLGSRAVYAADRWLPPSPSRSILFNLTRPLEEGRKNFLDFTGVAPYPPYPYLPQAAIIYIGRAFGAGPLQLLYFARLANALVATSVSALAVLTFPYRKLMLAGFAVMPMALSLYGSASPDALLIASSLLLSSLMFRWTEGSMTEPLSFVGLAVLGTAICVFKPVYTPLLVLGFPSSLRARGTTRALLEHGGLVAAAVIAALAWYLWLSPHIQMTVPWADPRRQVAHLLAHPLLGFSILTNTLWVYGGVLGLEFAGIFGWLSLVMPPAFYCLVVVGLVANATWLTNGRWADRRDALWSIILVMAVFVLLVSFFYITSTHVGRNHADGLQGRYFLPASGLFATALSSVGLRNRVATPLLTSAIVFASCAPIAFALMFIYRLYGAF